MVLDIDSGLIHFWMDGIYQINFPLYPRWPPEEKDKEGHTTFWPVCCLHGTGAAIQLRTAKNIYSVPEGTTLNYDAYPK